MANGHGGARKGSGRKPKPLAEKIAQGNPGHRPLKKLSITGDPNRPKPPEYLEMTERARNKYPSAIDFFEKTVDWLETTGCLHMIPPENIANYALAKFFLVEAAFSLSITAVVGPIKLEAVQAGSALSNDYMITPFAKAFFECAKVANDMWNIIWQVVRDNSEALVKNPEEDFIAMISSQRLRKRTKGASSNGHNGRAENTGFTAEAGEI